LLLEGEKRFRLMSPDCASALHLYGKIHCLHGNGLISYIGNETRPDGVPLQLVQSYQLPETKNDTEQDDSDDDEEEEVVLGKGFDYVSSGEEEEEEGGLHHYQTNNQSDDFEEIIMNEDDDDDDDSESVSSGGDKDKHNKQSATTTQDGNTNNNHTMTTTTVAHQDTTNERRPDNFSKINPCQRDQTALHNEFPSYAQCPQVMVHLKAGQMLYLPAGWFHEVTSKSSSSSLGGQCHMALNYWYHPPDALHDFDNPYQDSDFWKKKKQQQQQQQERQNKEKAS
jgi:Cupin-like domain